LLAHDLTGLDQKATFLSFILHTLFGAGNKKQLGTTFVAQKGTTALHDTARPCRTKALVHLPYTAVIILQYYYRTTTTLVW